MGIDAIVNFTSRKDIQGVYWKGRRIAGAMFLSTKKNDLIGRLTEVPMGSFALAGATTN